MTLRIFSMLAGLLVSSVTYASSNTWNPEKIISAALIAGECSLSNPCKVHIVKYKDDLLIAKVERFKVSEEGLIYGLPEELEDLNDFVFDHEGNLHESTGTLRLTLDYEMFQGISVIDEAN